MMWFDVDYEVISFNTIEDVIGGVKHLLYTPDKKYKWFVVGRMSVEDIGTNVDFSVPMFCQTMVKREYIN